MADYSSTPLSRKLGMKAGMRMLLVNAPENIGDLLVPIPENVMFLDSAEGHESLDLALLFVDREIELLDRFGPLAARLTAAGMLWVAYPKKAAKVPTDLTFENVQRIGLDAGLVDNKSCAIDATWSAVRFVIRLKDRPTKQANDSRSSRGD
jgi:hypothetical protein